MRVRLIVVLIGAMFALNVHGARAATSVHSFEGSCAIVGYAEMDDPTTPIPTQSWFRFRGQGRCAGTLDGSVLPERGIPVAMRSHGPRTVQSCALGVDKDTTWSLTFDLPKPQRDVTIRGYGDIVDALRVQGSLFHGDGGGTAVAQNTIQGHNETLQRCLADGVSSGSLGIQLDTLSPLMSRGLDDAADEYQSLESTASSGRPSGQPAGSPPGSSAPPPSAPPTVPASSGSTEPGNQSVSVLPDDPPNSGEHVSVNQAEPTFGGEVREDSRPPWLLLVGSGALLFALIASGGFGLKKLSSL